MPISPEKTRTNKYCLSKRMHKFRECETVSLFFTDWPTNVLGLVNFVLYAIFATEVNIKIQNTNIFI